MTVCSLDLAFPTTQQPGSAYSIKNLKEKVKNALPIVMENQSFDNVLGGQKVTGLDNPIDNGPFCNPFNVTDPSEGVVCSEPHDFDSVTDGLNHGI